MKTPEEMGMHKVPSDTPRGKNIMTAQNVCASLVGVMQPDDIINGFAMFIGILGVQMSDEIFDKAVDNVAIAIRTHRAHHQSLTTPKAS
jgi:hypothetical protein